MNLFAFHIKEPWYEVIIAGLFNFSIVTGLGEGKLWIKAC